MKNIVKQLATGTFIAFLLLAGNVRADDTKTKALGLELIETSLQLENWMTDEALWNTDSFYTGYFTLETELVIESWMTSENIWNLNNNFVAETEAGIALESWMTSEEIWNVEETVVEEALNLEHWMTDSEVWN